jgi:hypothetical protein
MVYRIGKLSTMADFNAAREEKTSPGNQKFIIRDSSAALELTIALYITVSTKNKDTTKSVQVEHENG